MIKATICLKAEEKDIVRIKDVGVLEVELVDCHVKIGTKKIKFKIIGMGKKYGKSERIQLISLKEEK